jgi:hypothetical protein
MISTWERRQRCLRSQAGSKQSELRRFKFGNVRNYYVARMQDVPNFDSAPNQSACN